MTTLRELIESVKEKGLTKDQLENYRDDMSHVYADMQMELSNIEKLKALYFEGNKIDEVNAKVLSDIAVKRMWQATNNGLREIELKRYCLATKELLNSLKSRLYSVY